MAEYPEALVEKVAAAIVEGIQFTDPYTEHATRVLDALGLREEWAYMADGKFMFGPFGAPPNKDVDLDSGSRYVTDWEAIRD